jgi:predicted transcriptional regulator
MDGRKQLEYLSEKELKKSGKRFKKKRESKQVRINIKGYKILQRLSEIEERPMSTLLSDIVRWYLKSRPKDY